MTRHVRSGLTWLSTVTSLAAIGGPAVVEGVLGYLRSEDAGLRNDVIDLLNDYFDAMSEPIARHGGEILKFMGDAMLAMLPPVAVVVLMQRLFVKGLVETEK